MRCQQELQCNSYRVAAGPTLFQVGGRDIRVKGIHGGDIYRNQVIMDFSVNLNPLGMPMAVSEALHETVEKCGSYPDMAADKLKSAVSSLLLVPKEYLVFGNGASELFMAIIHALKPQKTIIPIPSFYGYEYAAGTVDGEIVYYLLEKEKGYLPGDGFLKILTEDVDMIFLANPNNPTGRLMSKEYLTKLLSACKQKRITVVLDECFIEFCGESLSMMSELEIYDNLLLVRAFTKIYAIPGVRLGYLICSDILLLNKVRRQLPEWNLSIFAQEAGCVCTNQSEFVAETVGYVRRERQFLEDSLKQIGLQVFQSEANFLLVYSERSLYQGLLEQGILIRDCENFRGLSRGYYRIAVKSRKDNEALIKAIGELK